MDNGTKMKWYIAVSANWTRASSTGSVKNSIRTPLPLVAWFREASMRAL